MEFETREAPLFVCSRRFDREAVSRLGGARAKKSLSVGKVMEGRAFGNTAGSVLEKQTLIRFIVAFQYRDGFSAGCLWQRKVLLLEKFVETSFWEYSWVLP